MPAQAALLGHLHGPLLGPLLGSLLVPLLKHLPGPPLWPLLRPLLKPSSGSRSDLYKVRHAERDIHIYQLLHTDLMWCS